MAVCDYFIGEEDCEGLFVQGRLLEWKVALSGEFNKCSNEKKIQGRDQKPGKWSHRRLTDS